MNYDLKSPFNYAGTKQNTLEFLFNHFPKKKVFVDMFCGGGSVGLTALLVYDKVIMNDVVTPLIAFYKEMHKLPFEKLKENVLAYKIDKDNAEEFANLRNAYNKDKDNPYKFFGVCSSCTNNLMRFNKKKEFNQTFGKRTINDSVLNKLKAYSDILYNNKKIHFFNCSFSDAWNCFKQAGDLSDVLFYLDPPYLQTEAGYNTWWSKELDNDFYKMLKEMNDMGTSFAMSNTLKHKGELNPNYDSFKQFNIIEVPVFFNKTKKKEKEKESVEILVTNF